MRSVTIPSPLKEKLDKYLSAFVLPDIDKICADSSLSNEETNLIKRYVKSYFSFKKRGNIKDLELIERIVWNEKLMAAFDEYSALYPFLADIRNELRYLNVFYSDIKGGQPWIKQRNITNVFTSPMSYSAYSILYAYVLAQKPKTEELSKYDEYDDPDREETKFNPVSHFYKWLRYDHEDRKKHSIEKEFLNFACFVIDFFWDERKHLLEMEVPSIDVKKTYDTACKWIESLKKYGDEKEEKPEEEIKKEEKPKKKTERVSIAYDLVLANRTANQVSTIKEDSGDSFAPYQVAINQINKNYPGVFPITDAGVFEAWLCLCSISDGQTNLIPIQEDERGKTFEASIYQLYKIAKDNDITPSFEDLARFTMGLDFWTYPRRFKRKRRDTKTKKEVISVVSLTLLYISDRCGFSLPSTDRTTDEEGNNEKRIVGGQKITFTLNSAFYEGIDDEVKDNDGNLLYAPIEKNGKELRYFPKKALRRDTTGWYSRFLYNLASCVQMLEENLLENVFDYNGQIEKAKSLDKDGIICDKVETRKGREPRAFATWEDWTKRQISKKQKPKDKKRLQAFFADAVKDGVIISFSLQNNKYTWKYKDTEEKQGL